jgi:hypothetical protein
VNFNLIQPAKAAAAGRQAGISDALSALEQLFDHSSGGNSAAFWLA